jgi:hypothetical protein
MEDNTLTPEIRNISDLRSSLKIQNKQVAPPQCWSPARETVNVIVPYC